MFSAKQLVVNIENKLFTWKTHKTIKDKFLQHQQNDVQNDDPSLITKCQKQLEIKEALVKNQSSKLVGSQQGNDLYQNEIDIPQQKLEIQKSKGQQNHLNNKGGLIHNSLQNQEKNIAQKANIKENILTYSKPVFKKVKKMFSKYVIKGIQTTASKIKQIIIPHVYQQIGQNSMTIINKEKQQKLEEKQQKKQQMNINSQNTEQTNQAGYGIQIELQQNEGRQNSQANTDIVLKGKQQQYLW